MVIKLLNGKHEMIFSLGLQGEKRVPPVIQINNILLYHWFDLLNIFLAVYYEIERFQHWSQILRKNPIQQIPILIYKIVQVYTSKTWRSGIPPVDEGPT